jgi:hypothetical protein
MPAELSAAMTMPPLMPPTVSASCPTSAAEVEITAPPTIQRMPARTAMSRGICSARFASSGDGASPRSSQRNVRRWTMAPIDTPAISETSTMTPVVISTTCS